MAFFICICHAFLLLKILRSIDQVANFRLAWRSFTKNRRPSYPCRLCSLSPYCLNRNNEADLIWNETMVVAATQGSVSIPFAGLTALQAWLAATTQSYWSARPQSTVLSKLVLLCVTSPQLASCYLAPSLCFCIERGKSHPFGNVWGAALFG